MPEIFTHDNGSWAFGFNRCPAPNSFAIHFYRWSFTWHFGEYKIPVMKIPGEQTDA